MDNYGLALKSLRVYFDMTQAELAEKLCVSNHAVSKWENGVNQPDVSTLRIVCQIFNITMEQFFKIASGESVDAVLNKNEKPEGKRKLGFFEKLRAITVACLVVIFSVGVIIVVNSACDNCNSEGIQSEAGESIESFEGALGTEDCESEIGNLGSEEKDSEEESVEEIESEEESEALESGEESAENKNITVSFFVDGTLYYDKTVAVGDTVSPINPYKHGYVLEGWYSEAEGGEIVDLSSLTASISVHAHFRPIQYKIVFTSTETDQSFEMDVEHGTTWQFPHIIFSRTGYYLSCWRTANGACYDLNANGVDLWTEDGCTVYVAAVWEWADASTYSVKFVGGQNSQGVMNEEIQFHGLLWNLPECGYTKVGYKFDYWAIDGKAYNPGDNFVMSEGQSLEVVAKWKEIVFYVNYIVKINGVDYGENGVPFWYDSVNCLHGDAFWMLEKKIKGWVIDGRVYGATENIGNLTTVDGATFDAIAIFELDNYTVSFGKHSNVVKGEMDNIVNPINKTTVLPECQFTNTGRVFVGWEYDGKTYLPGESFTPKADVLSYEFIAVWRPIKYYVVIVSELHPDKPITIQVEYGSTINCKEICGQNWDMEGLTLYYMYDVQREVYGTPSHWTNLLNVEENSTVYLEAVWEDPFPVEE